MARTQDSGAVAPADESLRPEERAVINALRELRYGTLEVVVRGGFFDTGTNGGKKAKKDGKRSLFPWLDRD